MARVLLWIVLGVVLFAVLRARFKPPVLPPQGQQGAGAEDGSVDAESMVSCALCGLHVPQSEALRSSSVLPRVAWYCCEDHRRRAHTASK